MNYKNIHDSIISNAKSQNRNKLHGNYENHHIIMTSVGGEDSIENTVLLTPKEHFIVHYLLWKMHPNDRKYRDPIFMFKHKGAANSRLYEAARLSHIKEMKENNPSLTLSDESRKSKSEKLSIYAKNRPIYHNAKISATHSLKIGKNAIRYGAILDESTKNKISKSVSNWYEENEVAEETKAKISRALFNYYEENEVAEETKTKLKIAALNRKKYYCESCNKHLDGGNFKQHMMKKHDWTDTMINEERVKQN